MPSIHRYSDDCHRGVLPEQGTPPPRALRQIEDYTPNFPAQHWDAIANFVRDVARDVQCATSTPVSDLMSVLARYVLWAWQTAGIDLDRETLFRPDVIEEFIDHACPTLTSSSRGTYRSRLLRARQTLLDAEGAGVHFDPTPLSPADPMRLYSLQELSALHTWASGQHTVTRRRDAATLLALGAGAGLASEDIVRLKTDDITIDGLGVLLKVTGRRARLVPVLETWEQPIIDAVMAIGPGLPVFGAQRTSFNNNAVSNLVARSSGVGIKPSLQRLRVTWILHHLNVGTPVPHLMKAAGIETLDAFDRYLRFLPEPDANEFRTALRGPSPMEDNS
ncbi:hypothetical protein [Ferrimicrobium acidiphilum]|uniref:Phage integrase family protein n=1 Tax=Ferrimicrobium acidiphilum TaxID=121039 RepID=A0ABV3Y3F8_9ACTN